MILKDLNDMFAKIFIGLSILITHITNYFKITEV